MTVTCLKQRFGTLRAKYGLLCVAVVLALAVWSGVSIYLSGYALHLNAAEITQIDFLIDPLRDEIWTLRDAEEIEQITACLNDLALRPRDLVEFRDTSRPRYTLSLRGAELRLDISASSVELFFSGSSRYSGTYPADTTALRAVLDAIKR